MTGSESAPPLTVAGTVFDRHSARGVLMVLAGMALMVTYVETMVVPGFQQFYTFFKGVHYSAIAWIISAYLLVGTVSTPIFGKLGDRFGKKRVLIAVMTVYLIAVSVAGFTPNIGEWLSVSRQNQVYLLIGARAVQGVGMAMFPLAFAMMPEVFPEERVAPAQGTISAMFGAGAALGLIGGGYITQEYGWQTTFHLIIPFAILLVALTAIIMRESPHKELRRIDRPGITSLGFALATFMLGITQGTTWGWTNISGMKLGPVPIGVPQLFVLSALGAIFFILWERRTDTPVVSFTALRQRNIWVSNVAGVLVGMIQFLFFITFVILVEDPFPPGFNQTEFQMGLLSIPAMASMLIFGPLFGRAISKIGPKPIVVLGFVIMGLGGVGLAFAHSTLTEMVLFSIPILVGNLAVLISTTNVIILSVPQRELGAQTGITQMFRNLGSAIGPVAATTIITSFLVTQFVVVGGVHVPVSAPANDGFVWAPLFAAVLSLLGLILSLGLKNYRSAKNTARD